MMQLLFREAFLGKQSEPASADLHETWFVQNNAKIINDAWESSTVARNSCSKSAVETEIVAHLPVDGQTERK